MISVVVPTRNRRALLEEAVASVRYQEGVAWELLVVNDASTDDTREYLDSIDDARVRVLHQERPGERSRARNLGLSQAGGAYVMFLDDDDLLRPRALWRLSAALDGAPEAVMASGALRFLERNLDSTLRWYPSRSMTVDFWMPLVFGWWANSGQNLFRTQRVREVGGFNPERAYCEDREMLFKLSRLGPAAIVPEVVLDYRIHGGQSKPADLDVIRDQVYAAHIESLPAAERLLAWRVRQAARRMEGGRARDVLMGLLTAPVVMRSPLLARPLWFDLRNAVLNGKL